MDALHGSTPAGQLARQQIAKQDNVSAKFQAVIARVLGYAKHETLRNLDRRFRAANIANEDQPDSIRIAFNLDEFKNDLLAAITVEQTDALQTAGQEMFDELGRSDPWKLPAQATIDFIQRRQNYLKDVPDEIWQTIKDEIAAGLDKGESIRDLSTRITDAFDAIDQGRAEVIASTETHAAYGFSRNEAAKAAGITYKKWVISGLPGVRPAHEAADQQVRKIDQPFNVGGEELMFPGDDSLGASPDNTINCRCILIPIDQEEGKAAEEALA